MQIRSQVSVTTLGILALLLNTFLVAADTDAECAYDYDDVGLSPYLHHTSEFKSNSFKFVLAVPTNYQFSNITFVNSNDTDCAGNSGWTESTSTETADKCMKLLTNTVSWSNLHNYCGATRQETTLSINFRFNIQLDAAQLLQFGTDIPEDQLEALGQLYRTLSNVFPVSVRFPRLVASNNNVTSVSNTGVAGQAVLQSVHVNPDPDISKTTMDLTLLTVVTFPNTVTLPSVLSVPENTVVTVEAISGLEKCLNQAGSVCAQTWKLHVASTSNQLCDFSGSYSVDLIMGCQTGITDCPESKFNATLKVKTSNHCPIATTAQLDGFLSTYKDVAYEQVTNHFKLRDRVYAQLEALSQSASITSVTLVDVALKLSETEQINMLSGGQVTTHGTEAACAFQPSSEISISTSARFNCKLIPSHITMPSGSSRTLTWIATAAVEFQNTASINNNQLLAKTHRTLITKHITHHHGHDSQSSPSSGHIEGAVIVRVIDSMPRHEREEVTVSAAFSMFSSISSFTVLLSLLISLIFIV